MASSKDIRITIASALNAAGIEATKAQVAAMAGSVQKSLAEMSAQNRHHWADIKAAWDMGLGAIRKIGGLIQGALRKAFDSEYALTNFKTMLGSIDDAKKHVAELKQFAAETPLTFGDLSQASKTLLAFGADVNDILPSLKILGDISLGNAEKFQSLSLAFGKVQSEGKLTGVTLKQMIIAGFNPLQEIVRKTGASMDELKDMMENGCISFDLVRAAMESATGEGGRFNNAMKDASQTGAGLFSTMQDNWNATVTKFGTAFLNAAKGGIAKIIEAIQRLNKDGTLDVWADKTAKAVDKVVAAVKVAAEWGEKLVKVYRWVQDKGAQVGAATGAWVGTVVNGGSRSEASRMASAAYRQERTIRADMRRAEAKRDADIRAAAEKKRLAAEKETNKRAVKERESLESQFAEARRKIDEDNAKKAAEAQRKEQERLQKQRLADLKEAHELRIRHLREEIAAANKDADALKDIASNAQSEFDKAFALYRDPAQAAEQIAEERAYDKDLDRLHKDANRYGGKWRIDALADMMRRGDDSAVSQTLREWRKSRSFTPEIESMVRASAAERTQTTIENELRKISANTQGLDAKLDQLLQIK